MTTCTKADTLFFGCHRFDGWRVVCRRFFNEEDEDDEVQEQGGRCQEKGHAHTEKLSQDTAKERSDNAAGCEGTLHDAQADAQFFGRCVNGHDGQFHRPETG